MFRSATRPVVIALLAALALTGCKKKAQAPVERHKPVQRTAARSLQVAPGGAAVGFVGDIRRPDDPNLPETMFLGTLSVVSRATGQVRALGKNVSTLEDGWRFSPDGRWVAFTTNYRFKEGVGSLMLAKLPDGEPVQVASITRFYQFSADGKFLGFVAMGKMKLRDLETGVEQDLADNASSFEIARDNRRVLVRRTASTGGDLVLALASKEAPEKTKGAPGALGFVTTTLGYGVGDYAFSKDGKSYAFMARAIKLDGSEPPRPDQPSSLYVAFDNLAPKAIAEGVASFDFSPDGERIAFVSRPEPQRPGHLSVVPATGGEPRKISDAISEYRWSPNSQGLAIREDREDDKGRRWYTLKLVAFPGAIQRLKEDGPQGFKMESYSFSSDGKYFAYLKPAASGSIDLFGMELAGAEPPLHLAPGAYGYQFAPGDREIWYRTGCTRSGRECDLMAVSVEGGTPRLMLNAIWNWRASENGRRMLVTYPRYDTEGAADIGWVDLDDPKRPSHGIDAYTLLGARFLDAAGSGIAYIVIDPKREGVFVVPLE